jgi:GGDEF domain-containing protein
MRGRCLVAAGGAALLLGMLLGERPLVQLAVFVLALPLLSALLVLRERFRLSARRTVSPARLPRGGSAQVVLEVTNADSRPGGLWVLTEQVPPALAMRPDLVSLVGGGNDVLRPGSDPDALADLLEAAVHRDVPTPAGPLRASVGIAVFEESTTADEILSRADDAMYADKGEAGRPGRHLRSVE